MHLILHLGPSKTGSSAIQAALKKNSELLASHGVLQPSVSGHDLCFRYRYDSRLPPNMERRFGSLKELTAKTEGSWQSFEAEIRESDYDTVLVSSEDIPSARLRDEMLRRFQKSFDKITGIFYFRDPVELYVSEINQRIRHGLRLRHTPTPLTYNYRHLEFADWFAGAIGSEGLICRNFDRSNLFRGDVVQDFFRILSTLCGVPEEFTIPKVPVNQSLSGASSAWMYTFNEILDRRFRKVNSKILERRSEVVKQLRKTDTVNNHAKLRLDDPILQSVIRQKSDAELRMINEKYLAGQTPLRVDNSASAEVEAEEVKERMREWLVSYLTQDAAQNIARELLTHSM